jgi:hypothetical protein
MNALAIDGSLKSPSILSEFVAVLSEQVKVALVRKLMQGRFESLLTG